MERYEGKPGDYGYYDPDTHTLHGSSWMLDQEHPREGVNTIAHEDRHAYQQHAIENPDFHGNAAQAEAWRENAKPENYISADEDYEGYRNQPIERDAWEYGDRIAARLYGEEDR